MRAFLVTPKKYRHSPGGGIISPDMTVVVESRGNNSMPYFDEVISKYLIPPYCIDIRKLHLNISDCTYRILK